MTLASIVFFALLAYVHCMSDLDQPLHQPLCGFREGEFALLGYALFSAIALIGALYKFSLERRGQHGDAANTVAMGALLLIVAATPTGWALHDASAFVLLASIYVYFAVLLQRRGQRWMLVHLSVPFLLAVATGFQSYGIWQKGLIAYFVVAAMVHHHVVARRAHAPAAARADRVRTEQTMDRLQSAPIGAARHRQTKRSSVQ